MKEWKFWICLAYLLSYIPLHFFYSSLLVFLGGAQIRINGSDNTMIPCISSSIDPTSHHQLMLPSTPAPLLGLLLPLPPPFSYVEGPKSSLEECIHQSCFLSWWSTKLALIASLCCCFCTFVSQSDGYCNPSSSSISTFTYPYEPCNVASLNATTLSIFVFYPFLSLPSDHLSVS